MTTDGNRPYEVAAPTAPAMPDPNGAAGAAGTAAAGSGGAAGMAAGTPAPIPMPDAGAATPDAAVPDAAAAPDTGTADTGTMPDPGAGETGRLVGMTAAHNAVRARAHDPEPSPALEPLTWSSTLAATAQAYANEVATDCQLAHSNAPGLGENLASNGGWMSNPMEVVEGWAAEEACYTFGAFFVSDACNAACVAGLNSNGCGHYTQIVWRATTTVGCGFATCSNGNEIWVCNYEPQGNFVGMTAY